MFDDEKIKLIEAMPDSDSIILIWVRLIILAGRTNNFGQIYITQDLPYSDEMLAQLFNKKLNVVRLALETLEKFKMIEIHDDVIEIINWGKYQNVDGLERAKRLSAERSARYRERKKLATSTNEDSVTQSSRDVTPLDKDRDKELDIDLSLSGEPKQSINVKIINEFNSNNININRWKPDDLKKIIEYVTLDNMDFELVAKAIEQTGWANRPSFAYLDKILSDKLSNGIVTIQQWDDYEANRNKKQKSNGSNSRDGSYYDGGALDG